MGDKKSSWVWQYAKKKGNVAYCLLCDENENNEFLFAMEDGGTTGSIGRHLMAIHSMMSNEVREKRRWIYIIIIIIIIPNLIVLWFTDFRFPIFNRYCRKKNCVAKN